MALQIPEDIYPLPISFWNSILVYGTVFVEIFAFISQQAATITLKVYCPSWDKICVCVFFSSTAVEKERNIIISSETGKRGPKHCGNTAQGQWTSYGQKFVKESIDVLKAWLPSADCNGRKKNLVFEKATSMTWSTLLRKWCYKVRNSIRVEQ